MGALACRETKKNMLCFVCAYICLDRLIQPVKLSGEVAGERVCIAFFSVSQPQPLVVAAEWAHARGVWFLLEGTKVLLPSLTSDSQGAVLHQHRVDA